MMVNFSLDSSGLAELALGKSTLILPLAIKVEMLKTIAKTTNIISINGMIFSPSFLGNLIKILSYFDIC